MKNGADIDKPMNVASYSTFVLYVHHSFLSHTQDGATPLFIACYSGHIDIVNTLVTNGADINQPKKVYTAITFHSH